MKRTPQELITEFDKHKFSIPQYLLVFWWSLVAEKRLHELANWLEAGMAVNPSFKKAKSIK